MSDYKYWFENLFWLSVTERAAPLDKWIKALNYWIIITRSLIMVGLNSPISTGEATQVFLFGDGQVVYSEYSSLPTVLTKLKPIR